jgi:hypothetical protein
MIEKTIRDYLKDELKVPVYLETPKSIPDKYIVIEKTGSSTENYITSSTFAINSYDTTLLKTVQLSEGVKAVMRELADGGEVTRVELSEHNHTDNRENKYCYQVVADVTHYEI